VREKEERLNQRREVELKISSLEGRLSLPCEIVK
jgi:hypothetical protein